MPEAGHFPGRAERRRTKAGVILESRIGMGWHFWVMIGFAEEGW
jgi:hypothetical protein